MPGVGDHLAQVGARGQHRAHPLVEAEDLLQEVWLRRQTCDKVFAVLTVTASAEGVHQVLWRMNPGKLAAAV